MMSEFNSMSILLYVMIVVFREETAEIVLSVGPVCGISHLYSVQYVPLPTTVLTTTYMHRGRGAAC
jgi:hypothetical protein